MADEAVNVSLTADNRTFIQKFNESTKAVQTLTSAGSMMAKAFMKATQGIINLVNSMVSALKRLAVAAAILSVGTGYGLYRAIKNFADFEEVMANVSTVMSGSTRSAKSMGEAVMKMSTQFPQSAEELARGLYEVNSAGFQANDALVVLNATAKFSVAGLTDMTTAVRGTASIINAYQLSASAATHVTDVMFKAVEVGQMTAEEFTVQIGDWAASAASLGVPFETAAAALATMTTKGALPAMIAATALNAMFRALIRPSSEMGDAIKRAGYESGKAMLQHLGLAKTLETLWQQAGKNETMFAQQFQEVEAFRGALGLVNAGYGMLTETEREFNDATETAGTVQRAFGKQMDTVSAKSKVLSNEIRRMRYEVGAVLAPFAKFALGGAAGFIHFLNAMPEPLHTILILSQLLAPALIGVAGALAVMKIHSIVWMKTFYLLAGASFMGAFPRMKAFIAQIGYAGGPLRALRGHIFSAALASKAFRAELFRFGKTILLQAGAVTFLLLMLDAVNKAYAAVKRGAAEASALIVQANSGELRSIEQINGAISKAGVLWEDTYRKAGGSSIAARLRAGLQYAMPWGSDSQWEAKGAMEKYNAEIQNYNVLLSAATKIANGHKLSVDQILASLGQLADEGTIDLDKLIATEKRYDALVQRRDVQAYFTARERARRRGQDFEAVKMTDFMDPTVAAALAITLKEIKQYDQAAVLTIEKQKEIVGVFNLSSAASIDLAEAINKQGDAAATATEQSEAYTKAITSLFGSTVSLNSLQADMIGNIQNVGKAFVENGASFDLYTEAGRANQQAVSQAMQSAVAYSSAIKEQTGDSNAAAMAMVTYVQGIVSMGKAAGWSEEDLRNLIKAMGMTPEVVQTILSMPGLDPELVKLIQMNDLLTGIDGRVVKYTVEGGFNQWGYPYGGMQGPPSRPGAPGFDANGNPINGMYGPPSPRSAGPQLPTAAQKFITEYGVSIDKLVGDIYKIDDASSKAAQDFADALETLGDSASDTNAKLTAYKTIVESLLTGTMSISQAEANLIASIEDAGRAFIDNGADFTTYTEKGRANRDAIMEAASAAAEYSAKIYEQTGDMKQANDATALYAQGMIAMAQNAGWSTAEISNMIQVMGLTPEVIQTLIVLSGGDPAIQQLLTTAGLLQGIDGSVANAQVNVNVAVKQGTGNAHAEDLGIGMKKVVMPGSQAWLDKLLADMKANLPPASGGGGGGGGGGTPKWKPTAAQLANMQAALATPIANLLSGELSMAWSKQVADKLWEQQITALFEEGRTHLGAKIIEEAMATGEDPVEKFKTMEQAYARLAHAVGYANADAVVAMTDSLEDFQTYVDRVEAMIEQQRAVEDWKATTDRMSLQDYRAILVERLKLYTEYSQEWMQITDQIAALDRQVQDEADARMGAQLRMGEISKQAYLEYLRSRLVGLEKYSADYMAIWDEIQRVEQEVVDETKASNDFIKNFADQVKQAFDDIKRSVEEPMLRATSLIAAFGDQTTLTQNQVEAFYKHMLEGTQRWVNVIKELKAKGINQAFLAELIQAGPQSLSFAEQVLAMGQGGIDFINEQMAAIAELAGGLGVNIAQGQVGTLNQTDNSVTINVGDISITGEMPGGVTLDQVVQAITNILNGLAVQVGNQSSAPTQANQATGAPA